VDGDLRQLASGAELVAHPADAAVARLIGYENVVDVRVDDGGNVLAAGRRTGLTVAPGPRPATLAIWAGAVHVCARDEGPLPATVARVTPGPGRHHVTLNAGVPLQAQLPLADSPPPPGTEVTIELDRDLAVVLDG
jgi:ABC-type sulfate/molybdate transport systems ATPase subunit